MPLNPVLFSKCAPAISTNIKQCGTVTTCNAKPVTADELSSVFMKGNDYRVLEALLFHDFEIKQCATVQNGLYDFFMANKVSMNKTMQTKRRNSGLIEIAPFVLGRQFSPINNAYWIVSNGASSGQNWSVRVASSDNIPADVRSFPAGMRVFIDGKSTGGSATKTAWKVVSATLAGDGSYVTLVLSGQNAASHLDSDKLGSPVNGILRRGTPNVSDFEKFCAEQPAYLNWKDVPFWVETTRTSMCKSTLYDKWRKLSLENPLYREYGDLDDIQKNKQLAADWQRRIVDTAFWSKALPGQNQNDYDALEEIDAFPGVLNAGGDQILGVEGGKCVGRRANVVGIYEQLAECGRITDLQGGVLNLPALFISIYQMMRVREGNNHPNPKTFDLFTDSVFAELFNQAMIKYYNSKSDNTLRLTMDVNQQAKKAEFGFNYRSYTLFWPPGVTINIITHNFFDDWLTAAAIPSNSMGDTARVLWVLDFTGIYPGILASKRKSFRTGDLEKLAAINSDYACVMDVNTVEQTLTSMTWTMVVECPLGNLVIENIANTIPEHATLGENVYPPATTSTTTTTFAPWTG